MISIFLSHNSNDKPFVRKLSHDLTCHGINTWVDEAEIKPGELLIDKIGEAIHECTYLGVILSLSSVESEWVKREVNIALTEEINGKKIKVIPILYQEVKIPDFLIGKLYVDFTKNYLVAFNKLLGGFQEELHNESYKEKSNIKLLNSAYQEWLTFDKEEMRLLNANLLNQILEIKLSNKYKPSIEILEYIFMSILFVIKKHSNNRRYLEWLNEINAIDLEKIYLKSFEYQDSEIRNIAIILINDIAGIDLSKFFIKAIENENNILIQRSMLEYLMKRKKNLPTKISRYLFSNSTDWLIKSYCLQEHKNIKSVLLFSDNSDYADGIATIIKEITTNFVEITPTAFWRDINIIKNDIFKIFDIIIVIRGESFSRKDNENFYSEIMRYVSNDGMLLSTPWVCWETKYNYDFRELLPFNYDSDEFFENEQTVIRQVEGNSYKLLDEEILLTISYELLSNKQNSKTLLETDKKIPILGYKKFGNGFSFYLNICQHSCQDEMQSPLYNVVFKKCIKSFFNIIMNLQPGTDFWGKPDLKLL